VNYALHPVSLKDPTLGTIRPVEHALGLDLTLGVGLGSRVAVGVDVPVALYQSGDKPLAGSIVSTGETAQSAIGDVGLHGKFAIVDASQGGFGLAALASMTLPTGDDASFLGERSLTAGARLLAEYTLIVASVQASLGYTARTAQRTWPDPGGVQLGDVMPWSVGASFKPDVLKIDPGHRQRWDLVVRGWLPVTPVGPFGAGDPGSSLLSPVILSLSDRIELGHFRDAYAVAGAEIGLTDAIGVPTIRGVLAIGWAPRNHDQDGDGVPDDVDQCPELPEDKDGYEDGDGCPELDNDDDGVLDKDDACPTTPGVATSDPKTNGCPQPDRDKDGVPDADDACPDEKGMESDDPKTNGCPLSKDRDKDGVSDKADRCPDQPEDKDGHEDEDGCPDPDDDGDGIADAHDACPREPGEPSTDPKLDGCPNPDRDGDTYENAADACPDEPETFNGVKDDDGCAETGDELRKGHALVTLGTRNGAPSLTVVPTATLAPGSVDLRAIALELNRHRDWTVLVAAGGAADVGLTKAAAIADALAALTHREIAEPVAWNAMKKEPATARDVKVVVVVGRAKEGAAAAPAPAGKP
jgi:hypothetical protein